MDQESSVQVQEGRQEAKTLSRPHRSLVQHSRKKPEIQKPTIVRQTF
jgi:hypothetical protein